MRITPELLLDLRAKARSATPGEWIARAGEPPVVVNDGQTFIVKAAHKGCNSDQELKDAEYIAAACPQAILELIDRIEALEKADNPQALTALGLIYADREKDLEKRITRLEKEANWLANKLAAASQMMANATEMETDDLSGEDWRKVAREAVKKDRGSRHD